MNEKQNYPLHLYSFCPSDTEVLHYDDFRHIMRLPNVSVRKEEGVIVYLVSEIKEGNVVCYVGGGIYLFWSVSSSWS